MLSVGGVFVNLFRALYCWIRSNLHVLSHLTRVPLYLYARSLRTPIHSSRFRECVPSYSRCASTLRCIHTYGRVSSASRNARYICGWCAVCVFVHLHEWQLRGVGWLVNVGKSQHVYGREGAFRISVIVSKQDHRVPLQGLEKSPGFSRIFDTLSSELV